MSFLLRSCIVLMLHGFDELPEDDSKGLFSISPASFSIVGAMSTSEGKVCRVEIYLLKSAAVGCASNLLID
jgi:hypothetical protein